MYRPAATETHTAHTLPKLTRSRAIFLVALFLVVFVSARLAIKPIDYIDYVVHLKALDYFWHGQSPYTMKGYLLPSWAIFYLAPLNGQPLETWLALTIALFAVIVVDLGSPAGLLQLAHPVFFTLIVSSNPEWILVGPGLWLLYRTPKGWGRGLAWLLLACKPQTTFILLLFDGWVALRSRDWKAFGLAAGVAIVTFILYPQPFDQLLIPHDWSGSVISNYTIIGAILATVFIVWVRWRRHDPRWRDYKTLGLLLVPVWTPYTLEYNFTAILFTMRGAGWLRNVLYLAAGYGLAYLFWRDFHVAEQVGMLGMLLLAAIFAPAYPTT